MNMTRKSKAHERAWAAGFLLSILISGCTDDQALEEWKVQAKFSGTYSDSNVTVTDAVSDVEVSPDGKAILSANRNKVRIWDVKTEQLVQVFGDGRYSPRQAKFGPDQNLIVTNDGQRSVRVWSMESGDQILELKSSERYPFKSAEFGPSGSRVVTATRNNYPRSDAVQVWDVSSGEIIKTFGGRKLRDTPDVLAARFSPDGGRILIAARSADNRTDAGVLREWDLYTEKQRLFVKGISARRVADADYSEDGRLIIAVYAASIPTSIKDLHKSKVSVLNAQSGEELMTLSKESHPGGVTDVGFNSTGSRLVTVSPDGKARIWDALSGEIQAVLEHPDEVNTVSFSPDGNCLVTGSSDGITRMWCRGSISPKEGKD